MNMNEEVRCNIRIIEYPEGGGVVHVTNDRGVQIVSVSGRCVDVRDSGVADLVGLAISRFLKNR